jgi:hypothetical protein
MSEDTPIVAPIPRSIIEVEVPLEVLPAAHTVQMPSAEEVRATEAVFTQQQDESHAVLGLLGLWTGTLLLHDLAVEHFDTPEEDDETPRREDRSHP